ncbi:MAG TPA: DUF4190 domain-containing protein [Clostridiaceae bacterium]|nr:DUF4190 domain-containing protein [Clostridiaceae bacterium]
MDENIQQQNNNNESKGMAIASMVLGILGLVFWCVPILNLILAVLALIFGIVVMHKKSAGKGMGIAGFVCGILGTLWGIYYIICYGIVFNAIY